MLREAICYYRLGREDALDQLDKICSAVSDVGERSKHLALAVDAEQMKCEIWARRATPLCDYFQGSFDRRARRAGVRRRWLDKSLRGSGVFFYDAEEVFLLFGPQRFWRREGDFESSKYLEEW